MVRGHRGCGVDVGGAGFFATEASADALGLDVKKKGGEVLY